MYKVKITETRYKTVEVDAINEEAAVIIISNQYRLKEIELLDGVDIGDVEFVAEALSLSNMKDNTAALTKVAAIQMRSDADFIANFCDDDEYIKDNGDVVKHMTCVVDSETFIRFMPQREARIIQELTK